MPEFSKSIPSGNFAALRIETGHQLKYVSSFNHRTLITYFHTQNGFEQKGTPRFAVQGEIWPNRWRLKAWNTVVTGSTVFYHSIISCRNTTFGSVWNCQKQNHHKTRQNHCWKKFSTILTANWTSKVVHRISFGLSTYLPKQTGKIALGMLFVAIKLLASF